MVLQLKEKTRVTAFNMYMDSGGRRTIGQGPGVFCRGCMEMRVCIYGWVHGWMSVCMCVLCLMNVYDPYDLSVSYILSHLRRRRRRR